ncbi:hypothetical protein Syun_006168 [Stephania yunnanensis]|uniref:Uncharacterized protein n=1 Tax=Stephania yunnanensis TaxID=152371 RepID=A0AAP0KXS4_9MAGN
MFEARNRVEMAALKLVMMMMGVVLVALLGASPPAVEARTHVPSILTKSETLENIDLDSVFVTGSSLNEKAISEVSRQLTAEEYLAVTRSYAIGNALYRVVAWT